MKNIFKRVFTHKGSPLRKKDGYVLIAAIIVLLIASLLMAGVVTVSLSTNKNTELHYNYQQAYYTAKSAVSAVTQKIIESSDNPAFVASLVGKPGEGKVEGMGEYTVYVSYADSRRLMITATAKYNGQSASAASYLVMPVSQGVIPTDHVLYLNGSATTGIGQTELYGNVYIDGPLNLGQGSFFHGFTVVNGETSIGGYGHNTQGLFSFGDVTLYGSGTIVGDVFTRGNLNMKTGSGAVNGNAYVDGSLYMNDGSGKILKDAFVGGSVEFGGGTDRIYGNLYYGNTVTIPAWQTYKTYVQKDTRKILTYEPVDPTPYSPSSLPAVNPPSASQNPDLYKSLTISNKTISKSGKLDSTALTKLGQLNYHDVVTIDTTKGDISLLLDNIDYNVDRGLKVEVVGPNNVFIYMTGNSKFTLNSNSYFGMKNRGANPQVFIIGNASQEVALISNSELNACVYIPDGKITASGSPINNTYKFIGSCIVKVPNIDSNVKFFYSAPNIKGTPLDIFTSGSASGSGSGRWILQNWG